jgi:signal transduction histidine kinase
MASNRPLIGIVALGLGLACVPASAQFRLNLEQASSRHQPDFAPAYEGQNVIVQGIAAARAVPLADYSHFVIEDESNQGLTLEGPEPIFASYDPGDVLEVEGKIQNRAGLPVLVPTAIRKIGKSSSPPARKLRTYEVNTFAHLGTLVLLEGDIVTISENGGGEAMLLGDPREAPVRVFISRQAVARNGSIRRFTPGDHVSIIGLSSQYCPSPPFDHSFQVVIASPAAVTLLDHGWIISPNMLFGGLFITSLVLAIWWFRERAMAAQRRRVRLTTALAEEVISATTPSEISKKLQASLPEISRASNVDLFILNRTTSLLDRVPTLISPEPMAVNVNSPSGPFSTLVALCFRNHTVLHIPDTRRIPILEGSDPELSRSMLLVPMFAQQEELGVLALKYSKHGRRKNLDEQSAMQHLANQIATSLKLQEQHSIREQLMRSEKIAAAGQLISGVANELRSPLNAIDRLANQILNRRQPVPAETELREIAFEAHRGSEIVGRLVSYSQPEQAEARPVNIPALVNGLFEFREREWELKGLHVRESAVQPSLQVLGNQSQLDQAILNLIIHAEQCLATALEKKILITSRQSGKLAMITIDYSDHTPNPGPDPFAESGGEDNFGLQVCQAIVQSHGGDIRLLRGLPSGSRFEVELPVYQYTPVTETYPSLSRPVRPLTMLLVEPDLPTQRKLSALLSARGHRTVPVSSGDEALDMVQRLRFDVVFSAVRLSGLNWVELFERIRRQIGSFVLLGEGHDTDTSRIFKGSDGYLLSKPVQDTDLQRLLASIETRQEPATHA